MLQLEESNDNAHVGNSHVVEVSALQREDEVNDQTVQQGCCTGWNGTDGAHSHTYFSAGLPLPDGRHGKVQLHEDCAERQQASRQEQHCGVAGPVRRRYVPRDLVGARGVLLDLLPCRKQAAYSPRITVRSAPVQPIVEPTDAILMLTLLGTAARLCVSPHEQL